MRCLTTARAGARAGVGVGAKVGAEADLAGAGADLAGAGAGRGRGVPTEEVEAGGAQVADEMILEGKKDKQNRQKGLCVEAKEN